MITIERIENEIEQLPVADQFKVLKDLSQRLKPHDDAQLEAMANDPDIRREMNAIAFEFAGTEADGLGA